MIVSVDARAVRIWDSGIDYLFIYILFNYYLFIYYISQEMVLELHLEQ